MLPRRLLRNDTAATAIEYGVLAAIVALAILFGADAIGDSLASVFEDVDGALDAAAPAP